MKVKKTLEYNFDAVFGGILLNLYVPYKIIDIND